MTCPTLKGQLITFLMNSHCRIKDYSSWRWTLTKWKITYQCKRIARYVHTYTCTQGLMLWPVLFCLAQTYCCYPVIKFALISGLQNTASGLDYRVTILEESLENSYGKHTIFTTLVSLDKQEITKEPLANYLHYLLRSQSWPFPKVFIFCRQSGFLCNNYNWSTNHTWWV